MPKLSLYSNFDYPEGQEQLMPWEFWTEEEKALVIKEGYKDLVLTSKQVKPYLDSSRMHFYTQWIVPIAAAAVCFGPLRGTVLANVYKKHPSLGFKRSSLLTAGFTLFWLNFSPFYINKQNQMERALKTMYDKVGSNVKTYNDMLSTSTTSTSLDKETWQVYEERNCRAAGIWVPEEDKAPPIMPDTIATRKIKKKFL